MLRPERVAEFLLKVAEDDRMDAARRRGLEGELKDARRRSAALVTTLEDPDLPVASRKQVFARLDEVGRRTEAIEAELASAAVPVPKLAPKLVKTRLDEWRRRLRESVTQARGVLERVLTDRIVFTTLPDGTIEFEAATRFSSLFAGAVAAPMPAGTILPPWIKPGRGGRGPVEAEYEAILREAEARAAKQAKRDPGEPGTAKLERPWRDSNPRSPP